MCPHFYNQKPLLVKQLPFVLGLNHLNALHNMLQHYLNKGFYNVKIKNSSAVFNDNHFNLIYNYFINFFIILLFIFNKFF